MKTSLKASLIAVAIATLPFGSHAAGLGAINVFSALGQPLRAEIEVNASVHELQTLQARIASVEAFRQANLTYSAVMPLLKVSVEPRGNRAVVRVTSDRPIHDPFVDLLVEVDWAAGRLIREYTFLLDPPAAGSAPAAVAAPVAPPSAAPPAERGALRAPAPAAPRGEAPPAGQYEVRRGDTLHSIAESRRPPTASLDQMLIALFRENPDAFEGANINRMRAGAILSVPAEPEVLAVAPAQARREVLAQAADFDAYRRRMAGTVASRPAAGESAPTRAGSGAIVPRVDEPSRPRASGDQVKVSPSADAQAAAAGDPARLARLQALEEELAARDKALEEANSRLAALEASIREMQQLLELRSQSLAQAPAAAAPAAPAAAPASAAEPSPAPARPPESAAPATAPAPVPKAVTPPPAPPAEDPGFLASLLDDPRLLAAGGGVLALLLGYAGFKSRERRKAERENRAAAGALSEMPPVTNSVFGSTGGQNVNTSDSSVIHTDFSQSGLSAIDADEGVDPVAEADVYMAYGRDAQAEEILLDALKADTSRPAIFLKLLEIYAQRKSIKQFETTASELYARTGGEGPDWEKAAEMGRRIDPDNPLYGSTPVARGEAGVATAGVGAAAVVAAASDRVAVPEAAAIGATLDDLDFEARELPTLDAAPAEAAAELPLSMDEPVPEALANTSGDAELIAALPEIDSAALDFDLDAGLGLGESASTVTAAPGGEELALDGLELDLDIGGADVADAVERAPMSATMIGDGRDLAESIPDMEFELAGNANEPTDGVVGSEFDLSATTVMDEAAPEPAPLTQDLEKTTFDSSLLDFDFNLEDGGQAEIPASAPVDLSSIDLDLPAIDAGSATVDLAEELPDPSTPTPAETSDMPSAEVLQEVDTKLELARAYEEMGDKEGARELIEEVLREGSVDQREAASRLLERLT